MTMLSYDNDWRGPMLALASALLFGASTPLAKLLLGATDPLLLAGLLYLGSGFGLAVITVAGRSRARARTEAPLRARDLPWIAAIVLFGGILGPALLMWGLATLSTAGHRPRAGDPGRNELARLIAQLRSEVARRRSRI